MLPKIRVTKTSSSLVSPELQMEAIALPECREGEVRSAIEAARSQLAGVLCVVLRWAGAVGRRAETERAGGAAHPIAAIGRQAGQVDLAVVTGETRRALARVAAFFAQAVASVLARIRVAQVHLCIAHVMLPHAY